MREAGGSVAVERNKRAKLRDEEGWSIVHGWYRFSMAATVVIVTLLAGFECHTGIP